MNRIKTVWSVLAALAILTTASTFGAHHEKDKAAGSSVDACWLKANNMYVGQWAGSGHWMGPNDQQTFSGTFTITETSPGNFKTDWTNAAGQAMETTWGVNDGKYSRNGNPFAVTHCSDQGSYMLVVQRYRNAAGTFDMQYTGAFKQDAVMHVTLGRPLGTDIPLAPAFSRLNTRVK